MNTAVIGEMTWNDCLWCSWWIEDSCTHECPDIDIEFQSVICYAYEEKEDD